MTVLRVDTIAGIGQTFGPLLDGDLEFNSQNYIVLPKGSSNQQGVLRTTEDVIGVGGTYYDNLVLAMPFNEATGLRDVSSRNRNPGAYGNVSISSTISKYYGSSAKFDGSGDYLQTPGNNPIYGLENANYTIEYWIYNSTASYSPEGVVFDLRDGTNDQPILYYSGSTFIYYFNGSSRITISNAITVGQWEHHAFVKNGTSIKFYKNGAPTGSEVTGSFTHEQNAKLTIGKGYAGASTAYFNGYIQDFRIYKGIAKYTANFTPPERIAETGVGFKTGALRYNTDSNKPELYDGNQWTELQLSSPALGRGADTGPGARGVFSQGFITPSPNVTGRLDYINIASTGDATTFHDATAMYAQTTFSSSTRGVLAGGASPDNRNILFITIASTGEQSDSGGDLSANLLYYGAGVSNSTRGLICGGLTPTYKSEIEYVTIASLGNSQDFGHLTADKFGHGACSNPTRGLLMGGSPSPGTQLSTIDMVTIATLGDAQDFGDLTATTHQGSGASNATRGVLFGGRYVGTRSKIEYVTIASLGNGTDFGDLSRTTTRDGGSVASSTRGVFAGGHQVVPANTDRSNVIDYIQISTQGDAVDFGDLTVARNHMSGMSNAHGGL